MERILLTPIPISYAAFIQEVAWVYCLLLPFQIYQLFGWLTIPATIIVTYILLGLVSCGQEIENPFGYDANGECDVRRASGDCSLLLHRPESRFLLREVRLTRDHVGRA